MKLLKAHSWIFLVLILGGAFLLENEHHLYLPQAEIEEECVESKEVERCQADLAGGRRLKSGGGGGDNFPPTLADTGIGTPIYSRLSERLARTHTPALPPASFPYYILYCNLKLPSC